MRWWRRRSEPVAGEGVWGAVALRADRAVRRVEQVVSGVEPGDVRTRLDAVAASVAAVGATVVAACEAAQEWAPSAALEIPAGPDGSAPRVHKALSQVSTDLASVAQAVALAVLTDPGDLGLALDRVDAKVDRAAEAADGVLSGLVPARGTGEPPGESHSS